MKLILGIETSCDDTSMCLLKGNPDDLDQLPEVLILESFSSEKVLKEFGGVVPEIAAREHMQKIPILLKHILKETQISTKDIDLIGVTSFPGLLGPLLTGVQCAKTIALIEKIPISPINHLYAHIEAIHIDQKVSYPYVAMLVSGGHSLFLKVEKQKEDILPKFSIIGSTIDDAAGEAFDKGGKLLGIGYPAGRIIDDFSKKGELGQYKFPIGLHDSKNSMLSFSGLKTSLRRLIEDNPGYLKDEDAINNICADYQEAIVDALLLKAKYALKATGEKLPLVIGGGVACNSRLRKKLKDQFQDVFFVTPKYCTDNGAMIANLALRTYQDSIPYPECLSIDAKSSFIKKSNLSKSSTFKL